MGHNTLSDKLDQIKKEDLGVHFDSSLLWDDLKCQIDGDKVVAYDHRLLIAACITFLILFSPFILVNNYTTSETEFPLGSIVKEAFPIEEINTDLPEIYLVEKMAIHSVERLPIDIEIAEVNVEKLIIKKMDVAKGNEFKRQSFADQDISIIQASLGTPTIEREKSVTLRAQLNTSSQPVQLNSQAFKIKLFDTSNQ